MHADSRLKYGYEVHFVLSSDGLVLVITPRRVCGGGVKQWVLSVCQKKIEISF